LLANGYLWQHEIRSHRELPFWANHVRNLVQNCGFEAHFCNFLWTRNGVSLLWQYTQRRQHAQKTQDWLGHIFFELLSELTSSGTSILWVIYSDYPLASLDNLFSLRWPVDTCAWTSKVHLRRFPKPRVTDKPGGSIAFTYIPMRRRTIRSGLWGGRRHRRVQRLLSSVCHPFPRV